MTDMAGSLKWDSGEGMPQRLSIVAAMGAIIPAGLQPVDNPAGNGAMAALDLR
ncbi:hypothetical protein [Polaromonas sp.]|uniref:hypothetical protein n=1 Tax=Polaromonas sp. TaxID=1869339 RepID=UPI003562A2C0